MQRYADRSRPDTVRDNRDRDRDRERNAVAGRPGVGAVVTAVITSVKPQLGLFVELPLPSKEFEGLVHLSEISWDIQQFVKRVRGQPDERERIGAEINKTWVVGDKPFVRILKYKQDRGKTVADVSMLDVDQRGAQSVPRSTPRHSSPVSRDLRNRNPPDDTRSTYHVSEMDRGGTTTAPNKDMSAEADEHRRKRTQMSRTLGSRDVRLPELHSLHQAKIINAFHDGIFVSLPGYEVDGLVHHSQISRQLDMDNTLPKVERFKRIQEIVGDIDYEVWVKIVYVAKTEHLKCECSLKMEREQRSISVLQQRVSAVNRTQVSQKNGRDLDPEHQMWLDYMRARRTKGAGYMHPEMKAEMERVERLIGGPDNSPIDENESASSKARLDPDTLISQEPARNDRDFNDRKRVYDDRGATGWNLHNSSAPKQPRYESAYDRRRPAWEGRNEPDGGPTTSRRRASDGQSMHDRQQADSYGRGGYPSEDRRPQSWNRAPTNTTYAGRPSEAHVASASFANLDILEDPAIKAKFNEVVAASVRQQLEALATGGPAVSLSQDAVDRPGQTRMSHHAHRDR